MSSALLILVFLILATPITIISNGLVIQGFIAAIVAVSTALVALGIRPGEARFLSKVIRPVAVVGVVPAIWMLIQILPMPSVGPAHSIWKSAAAALGHPLAGSISIDPGATLISFVRYASAAAIALVAAAVATDRRRAEWVMLALTAATTLMALMALALKTEIFAFFSNIDRAQASINAANGASLGIIFATAATLLLAERSKAQRPDQDKPTISVWSLFTACLVALGTCLVAVVVQATSECYYAVLGGLFTFGIAVMIRRLSLGPWGIAAIISTTLFVAIAAIALQPGSRVLDLTVNFASQASMPLVPVTQRVLAETSWAGSGAGTFASVLPIYGGIDELAIEQVAPTAAAALAIEMGWPIFWTMLLAVIALVFFLLRGALRRQRDSYYPMAGAGCIVVTALLSFGNIGLLTTPISIITAVAIGIAVAQSKSRLS